MRKAFLILLIVIYCIMASAPIIMAEEKEYTRLRHQMVREQLIPRGISDKRVISVMQRVPRHEFVPSDLVPYAYMDSPLPIGAGQTISQPYIVALMTQLLDLKGEEKVLEIGTGSGYQAAILAEMAKEVYTIEILKPLADSAMMRLEKMGYNNIKVLCADGYLGWPQHAPFDAIIVTAAPKHIPQPLVEQLKVGGKMVLPLGNIEQELFVITKTKEGITKKKIIPVRFVPMVGEAQK